ncbi:MAG: MBOAT family protein [Proteobacteria bacterium]|nr:MAG: MBOAT family protein [Pseudomonadota bacterium]
MRHERRETIAYGIQRFLLGLAKKTLLADTLGPVADQIFALSSNALTGPLAWIGIFTYGMQIYLDFSGYSDMALGLAAIFGIKFPENFNYPYAADSITDFWRRWHISLSNWFRDYLYIPLGGNRVAPWRNYLNLLTVFILCGLWHGANFTFLVWGLAHGLMLMGEKAIGPIRIAKIPAIIRRAYMLLFVFLAWVVFRSADLSQASSFYRAAFGFGNPTVDYLPLPSILNTELIVFSLISLIVATPLLRRLVSLGDWGDFTFPRRAKFYRYAYSAVLVLLTVASFSSLSAKTFKPFIYFKF